MALGTFSNYGKHLDINKSDKVSKSDKIGKSDKVVIGKNNKLDYTEWKCLFNRPENDSWSGPDF